MLNELGVEEREPGELVLIKVHHEKFVSGSQLSALACELPVEVGHILSVALYPTKTTIARKTRTQG